MFGVGCSGGEVRVVACCGNTPRRASARLFSLQHALLLFIYLFFSENILQEKVRSTTYVGREPSWVDQSPWPDCVLEPAYVWSKAL